MKNINYKQCQIEIYQPPSSEGRDWPTEIHIDGVVTADFEIAGLEESYAVIVARETIDAVLASRGSLVSVDFADAAGGDL